MQIDSFTINEGKIVEATDENIGQIIYITGNTNTEYPAGPYIVTGDGVVLKLVIGNDVDNLKLTVGDDESGLVKDVANLQTAVSSIKIPVKDVTVDGTSVLNADGTAVITLPKVDFTEVNNAIAGKVDKVEGSRLMTDVEGTKLKGIAENAQVNTIDIVKVNGQALVVDTQDKSVNVIIPEAAVKGIVANKENKQILSLNDGLIDTTLSLKYVHDDKNETPYQIQLLGVNNQVVSSINAADFVKDGMLYDAELVNNPVDKDPGTYLHLIFNTDSGKNDIYVGVSDLIDTYTGSDTITVDGKTISAKIDANATEKYLTSGVNGLYVSGINDAIRTAKSAVVGEESTDTKDSITLYGVKKYAKDLVDNANYVAKVDGYGLSKNDYSDDDKNVVDAWKNAYGFNSADELIGIDILTDEDGKKYIHGSIYNENLVSALTESILEEDGSLNTEGLIVGSKIMLGTPITGTQKNDEGVEETVNIISAATTVQSAIQTLAGQIQAAIAGGITAIDGGEYITVGGSTTSKTLTVNVAKIGKYLVDGSSAIKVDENSGKLTLEWEDVQ